MPLATTHANAFKVQLISQGKNRHAIGGVAAAALCPVDHQLHVKSVLKYLFVMRN
jgi:hypothetical protein